MKKAAVLGCGPTGLFAAHALATLGWDFTILSIKRRSEMYGAQYLHEPIPGLAENRTTVLDYRLRGTIDEYLTKVYGNQPVPFVSPEKLLGRHTIWNIRSAYYKAWSLYVDKITPLKIAANEVRSLAALDLVVITIPADQVCFNPTHKFESQNVWAVGDAPERGIFCPVKVPEDTIICNGLPSDTWYRASNVFGYNTVEWPYHYLAPESEEAYLVNKPISTDCSCFVGAPYLKVGRYGAWSKSTLSHHAYQEVYERATAIQ